MLALGLGLGLFGILWAMTKLASSPLDATGVGYLVGGVVMLAAFALIELRAPPGRPPAAAGSGAACAHDSLRAGQGRRSANRPALNC